YHRGTPRQDRSPPARTPGRVDGPGRGADNVLQAFLPPGISFEGPLMSRWCSLLLLAVAVTPARAHFIWLGPDKVEEDRATVRVIFSDTLEPGSPDLLARIAKTELFVCGPDGRTKPLTLGEGKDGDLITLEGKGPWLVAGVCRYGVVK